MDLLFPQFVHLMLIRVYVVKTATPNVSADKSISSPGILWVTKTPALDTTGIHKRFVPVWCLSNHPGDQLATRMTARVSSNSRITLETRINSRLPMLQS